MSFPPVPFHVYMNNSQLLVTFPSRSAADEYWRSVQEKMDPKQQPPPYRRYHSQHYHTPAPHHDDQRELTAACVFQEFRHSGSYGSESRIAPLPVAIHDHSPDNVNGEKFYIRSVVRPMFFWCFDSQQGSIRLSREHQTKFVIRRATPLPFECRSEEDILIGRDDINIFAYPEEHDGGDEKMIVRGATRVLIASSALHQTGVQAQEGPEAARAAAGIFKFKMFDKGFGVRRIGNSWEAGSVCVSSDSDGGDRWEFVQ